MGDLGAADPAQAVVPQIAAWHAAAQSASQSADDEVVRRLLTTNDAYDQLRPGFDPYIPAV
jgi:hypothetical protein